MASRGNSVLGDDCSEAQASGCRREELARSSGLNTLAAPYIPTSMQGPRNPMPTSAVNGYNSAPYMQQPPPQVYNPSAYQDVYSHEHNELSSNANSGVFSPYIAMDPAHLPMAYASNGPPLYYSGALMSPMYLQQRPDMYNLHHESGAREEGHPGSLNSTTPVCNTTSTSSSGTSHPPSSWTSATSAAAAPPPLLSTPPVSANSDNSFSHMPRYFDHSVSKIPFSVQPPSSMNPNKRLPDPLPYRATNPPSNSIVNVQNCHVSVALFNQPGSYTDPHHPPNPGAPLAHPSMNTSFAPPFVCPPGGPIPYGMCNPSMDVHYASQGMQIRQPKPHRAPTDARISAPRGRGPPSRGNDVRRSRHSEGDRSSMGSNINRNSMHEDGCDFVDGEYNVQANNEVDSNSSRTAMLDANSGMSHHLEGSPLILGQAPLRFPNIIPYQSLRVVPVNQGLSPGICAPQGEEPINNSTCSSPCDSSNVVAPTPTPISVSSPDVGNNNSTVHNGLVVDPSFNGSHAIQSNDVAGYEPVGALMNSSTRANNTASYVSEDYVGPAHDAAAAAASMPSNINNPTCPDTASMPSNLNNSACPATAIESSSAIGITESVSVCNMAPLPQTTLSNSNHTENNVVNQSIKAESVEMPVQETPAIYTATVTAHQPSHSSFEVTEAISNLGVNGDEDACVAELETEVPANHAAHSASPSCLEQSFGSPESELGDLKPIFETKDDNNLSFTIMFGDLTPETLVQELQKIKTSLPATKSRVEGYLQSQNVPLSITSSNPVFDTSLSSANANISSALDFGTVSENDDIHASRPEIRSQETIVTETQKKVDMVPQSPPSLVNDVQCSVTNSSIEKGVTEVPSPTLAVPTTFVSSGGSVVAGNETNVPSTVLSYSVTAEKPPLPSAPKKQLAMNNATGRPLPTFGVAPVETPAPSAWGKNKNWKEEFKGNVGEYRSKSTAIISPMIRNGVMEGEDFASANSSCCVTPATEAAVASPANETHTTTSMPPPPVDGAVLKMDKTKVGGFLTDYKTDSNSVTLQPRGLTNKNYWCYANTVLQALTAVPQFVNLYTAMQKQVGGAVTPHSMPISYSIISYLKEFSIMNTSAVNLGARARKKAGQNIVNLPEVQLGDPFEPSSIQNMLLDKPGGQFMEGCQQDAEEMLSFLLNASHDEFNECLKLSALEKEKLSGRKTPVAAVLPNGQTDENNDDWVTMGPKNKTCITRTTEFSHSPISEIFWGESRVIIKKGNSPVTNNLEPFITLPLDIQDENVKSVKEALHQFVSKADVAGYTCTDTQEELTVSSQRLLEQLPQVLILQLKRFVYLKDGGLQKVIKDISLSVDLEISKELISQQRRKKLSGEKVKYKLVSVIYHDGKDANKGHYVCNVYHPGYHCWLHYDDACVKPIGPTELQRCYAPRVPYLLFYRRADTFAEDTAPSAIQPLPSRRRTKDKRNASSDKVSCERRPDTETRTSNDGPSAPESHSRVSSVDRKPTSTERKVPEKNSNNNPQRGNNKRQDKKQHKNKQAAKN